LTLQGEREKNSEAKGLSCERNMKKDEEETLLGFSVVYMAIDEVGVVEQ